MATANGDLTPNHRLGFLNKLRQNQTVIATFVLLKGVRAAQVLAHTGVDAVFIDCEHGDVGDSDMHDMVTTIVGSGVSPVIRVPSTDGAYIKRALDTGTHGILVPMISTAEQARAVVSLAKFPPVGVRGQGSPFACLEHGYSNPSDYIQRANESIITMVQIETPAGIENVEDICQVDGVDLLFIGPNDLALTLLGYTPAKWTETVFLEAVDKVVATAKKYGKKVGITAMDGGATKKALERFDLVILSGDVKSMQAWYKRELKIARSREDNVDNLIPSQQLEKGLGKVAN